LERFSRFVLFALLIYLCLSLFVVPVGLALMAAASRADDAPDAPPADPAAIPPHATPERKQLKPHFSGAGQEAGLLVELGWPAARLSERDRSLTRSSGSRGSVGS
jgi:hypothetical protein